MVQVRCVRTGKRGAGLNTLISGNIPTYHEMRRNIQVRRSCVPALGVLSSAVLEY
ncbi:hypothetical protein Hanom_Chr06g00491821 [Helianthus anomalus]